jgi:hypothetical protein
MRRKKDTATQEEEARKQARGERSRERHKNKINK